MSSPFESYDDLEDADERLQAADPAERRVAIIALGHSGDPAAVGHLASIVTDPDAGVRQQVAMALGEFDGPEAASALVKLLVDPGTNRGGGRGRQHGRVQGSGLRRDHPAAGQARPRLRPHGRAARAEGTALQGHAEARAGSAAGSRCRRARAGDRRDRLPEAGGIHPRADRADQRSRCACAPRRGERAGLFADEARGRDDYARA